MVELRKRPPPATPAAPAPPPKKSRAASSSKSKPAAKKEESSIASKAKAAASKVKDVVTGPTSSVEPAPHLVPRSSDPEAAAAEPESAVEKGETGLIPETAGTAPSSTTVPAAAAAVPATAPAGESSEGVVAPAPEELENPPEKGGIASAPVASGEHALLPLTESSIGKIFPLSMIPSASVQTHTGRSVFLTELFTPGKGIIIFTYPKASTPGCTTQVCMFRDNHDTFTGPTKGYTIYGLSTDSVKANANFAAKQKIQYELLCDPDAALTGALGMKKAGNAKGTVRGVVVVDAEGKVRVWGQAGPARTVEVVKEFLAGL